MKTRESSPLGDKGGAVGKKTQRTPCPLRGGGLPIDYIN